MNKKNLNILCCTLFLTLTWLAGCGGGGGGSTPPAPPAPSNPGIISGVVTDKSSDAVIANALVSVTVNGTTMTARTDSSGKYILSNIAAGTQTVYAVTDNYYQNSNTVNVQAGGTVTADLVLTSSIKPVANTCTLKGSISF